jgi:ATP-binding cassette subfamily B (MDR/TAP) protein 1
MVQAVMAATSKAQEQYAAAGGLATESLGAIRTVTALNAQPSIITKYRVYLFQAMRVGIGKGVNVGLGHGTLFFAAFATYGLGT